MKRFLFALMSIFSLACGPGCATTRPAAQPDALSQALIAALSSEPAEPPEVKPVDIIFFEDEVADETVARFSRQLDANIAAGQKVIIVEIDTGGGSLSAGFAMAKAMERSPVPVMCVVDGGALSMGLAVLQSCDVRTMTERSVLMGHEVASGTKGQTVQAENLVQVLRVMNEAMAAQICSKAKVTPEQYLKKIADGHEWWMSSKEALKAGFIDFEVSSLDEAVAIAAAPFK